MKIAIVHDALVVSGGAERVAVSLSQVFPEAPIFTSVYLPENTFPYFKTKEVHTLPGSSLARNERQFKRLFPVWFYGFRHLDLSAYDLIISSASYAAKYIKTPARARHISYLHNPFRLLWKRESYTGESLPYTGLVLRLIDGILPVFRKIDRHYTGQIDQLVTNSQHMAGLIQKIYGKQARIIHPPIHIHEYHASPVKADYYLFVGRLLSYKRADLAIQACQKSKRKLRIVGEGQEFDRLKQISGDEITFLGKVDDAALKKLYAEARGLIFPGFEDFGIVPLEAQASGCPVVAYRAGGALETVIENETGLFFSHQTVEDLLITLDQFENTRFNIDDILKNAARFDISFFHKSIHALVEELENCP